MTPISTLLATMSDAPPSGPAQAELLRRLDPYLHIAGIGPRAVPTHELVDAAAFDDLVLEAMAHTYDLLPDGYDLFAEPLGAVALVGQLPKCDMCSQSPARFDVTSCGGSVPPLSGWFGCDPCRNKYRHGRAPAACTYLVAFHEVSDEVQALCDAVALEQRRPSFWSR